MTTIASQITSLTVVYSIVYSSADQRKHQSSASLAFVRAIHRGPVNSPHKWLVTRKMFPFDDVIMHREMMETNNIAIQNNGTKDTATTKFSILNYFSLLALDCVHFEIRVGYAALADALHICFGLNVSYQIGSWTQWPPLYRNLS